MLCNAYDDMSNFSARSKHQRCYTNLGLDMPFGLVLSVEMLLTELARKA